jgi:hypothetical protein
MLGYGVQGPEPQVVSNLLVRGGGSVPPHVVLNKPVDALLGWSQRRHEIPFFISFDRMAGLRPVTAGDRAGVSFMLQQQDR